jgi:leucyl-tRNA synthetase
LLGALDGLKDWPEKVRLMQANWIGKSRGLQFAFQTRWARRQALKSWRSTRPGPIR